MCKNNLLLKALIVATFFLPSASMGEVMTPLRSEEAFTYGHIETEMLFAQSISPNVAFFEPDGAFYLAGERDYGKDGIHASMVTCVNTAGQILWEHILPASADATTCSFRYPVALTENKVAALHYEYIYQGNTVEASVCDLVIIGNEGIIAQKALDTSTRGLYPSRDGLLLATAEDRGLTLTELDLNLSEKWKNTLQLQGMSLQGIEMTGDGYLLFGGLGDAQSFANSGGSYIGKISCDGDLQWEDITSYAPRRYTDAHIASDDEYIAVGCELGEDITKASAASFKANGTLIAAHNFSAFEYGLYQQVITANDKTYVVGYSYTSPIELCVYELDSELKINRFWKSAIPLGEGFALASPALFLHENTLIVVDTYRGGNGETAPIYILQIDLSKL